MIAESRHSSRMNSHTHTHTHTLVSHTLQKHSVGEELSVPLVLHYNSMVLEKSFHYEPFLIVSEPISVECNAMMSYEFNGQ